MSGALASLLRAAADVLVPAACSACGDPLAPDDEALCTPCRRGFQEVGIAVCPRCGNRITDLARASGRCRHCPPEPVYFATACAAFHYRTSMRQAIHRFKYEHHHELGRPLAQAMFAAFLRREDWWGRAHTESIESDPSGLSDHLDVLVPVPMHYTRRWRRGYNHADVLAREFCRLARLAYADDLLARIRRTPRQALLPEDKRAANVRGAFEAPPGDRLHGLRVGLFDDVLTSCSTVNECARTLCAAGALEVHVLSLARA